MSEKEILNYDLLILGGGPAGLSAGIYGARGNVSTAIVDISMFGGQPSLYLEVENYPGFKLVGGFDLMNEFEEHADKFAINKYPNEEIISVDLKENDNTVETSKKIFKAKTLIIAAGAQAKKLGIPGEKEFAGRGVSYCAICDGSLSAVATLLLKKRFISQNLLQRSILCTEGTLFVLIKSFKSELSKIRKLTSYGMPFLLK